MLTEKERMKSILGICLFSVEILPFYIFLLRRRQDFDKQI